MRVFASSPKEQAESFQMLFLKKKKLFENLFFFLLFMYKGEKNVQSSKGIRDIPKTDDLANKTRKKKPFVDYIRN